MDAETDSGEGRWMTYAELATARGIDKNSAARLTFRRHWRRQRDNHGTVRVFVPADFQDASRDASRELSGDVSGDLSRDMSRVIKPLEDAIAALREQQDHERRAWRDERTRLMAERDHAEQGREGERARADELRDRIEVMAADLAAARGAEDRARAETDLIARKVNELTKANEARRARGRWARLRAAWRGE